MWCRFLFFFRRKRGLLISFLLLLSRMHRWCTGFNRFASLTAVSGSLKCQKNARVISMPAFLLFKLTFITLACIHQYQQFMSSQLSANPFDDSIRIRISKKMQEEWLLSKLSFIAIAAMCFIALAAMYKIVCDIPICTSLPTELIPLNNNGSLSSFPPPHPPFLDSSTGCMPWEKRCRNQKSTSL